MAARILSHGSARSHTTASRPHAGPHAPPTSALEAETLLALRRSAGNQAVCQLVAVARPIQRFVENDPLLAPGKVSETGQLAVIGQQEAYGTATAITDANQDASAANTDNVTFETAANINAGMTEGKSLGFFEMYGTANPVQTFSYITLRCARRCPRAMTRTCSQRPRT